MNSDEERLEEMLKAVMGNENAEQPDQSEEMSISDIMDDMLGEISDDDLMGDLPEIPDDDLMGDLPEIPDDDLMGDLPEISGSGTADDLSNVSDADMSDTDAVSNKADSDSDIMADLSGEMPEMPEMIPTVEEDKVSKSLMDMEESMAPKSVPNKKGDEMPVDPLALLDMSEEEIDRVLDQETAGSKTVSEKAAPEKELSDLLSASDELSDIQNLLSMSDNHEMVADERAAEDMAFGSDVDLDSDDVKDLLGLTPEMEEDLLGEAEEGAEKEPENRPEGEAEEAGKPKGKQAKKEKKASDKKKEKKEGFGKKLAMLFFGADDELDEEAEKPAGKKEQSEDTGKKGNAKAEKKKKEKKKKPAKKEGPDPKKAAKEKQQKAKSAEKAKKKAEKAEKAEKERRAAKKLPKKKVFVWVLLCASIAAGILLMNTIGMDTLHLTEARNAFYDKDFETVYQLMNGRELEEEDQMLFMQSSAILHLMHAEEFYENHLKMEKPVMALDDLMKGVDKYQEIVQAGEQDLITPELAEQYQKILQILQDKYSLSEEGAMEINALKDDYEYSLRLEALVNGEVYQSQSEIEQQEEETESEYSDLEDLLPEEEEYLNDSGN